MRKKDSTVLAADADPDANLGLALGFPEEELDYDCSDFQDEKTCGGADRSQTEFNQDFQTESEGG